MRDVGVDDELQVRESLAVVTEIRWGTARAGDSKEYLGGVPIVWAPTESMSIIYVGDARQHWIFFAATKTVGSSLDEDFGHQRRLFLSVAC